jgi:hypothetical protein
MLDFVPAGFFDGLSSLNIGYGSHFTHLKTKVEISAVPRPSTRMLFRSGWNGLAG